jgi:hypothetical protein
MFTPDATIDLIQTGKKTFVNTFVTNEVAKKAMIEFIDAQADYTKKATKVGMDTATKLTSEAVKMTRDAASYDWSDAFDNITKAFTPAKK